MLFFHKVDTDEIITRHNPLYVGHFFQLSGMRGRNRIKRQNMIISIAFAWYNLVRHHMKTPGMIDEELFLTRLTSEVREAKHILLQFFHIERIGFKFADGQTQSPTLVRPRRMPQKMVDAIDNIINKVVFRPGLPPLAKGLTQTQVSVQKNRASFIRMRLRKEDRDDLIPAVDWLLDQPNQITFYYKPAGSLKARDTSVWPVRAIEQWPGWLRTELFGTTIDIENAFCQFLLDHLEKTNSEKLLNMKYPDLMRAAYDKKNFREELCITVLNRSINDENIKVVKKLIMALANGSNASPLLMVSEGRATEAVQIVREVIPDLPTTQVMKIGERLQSIARQFRNAKREVYILAYNRKPDRNASRKIFQLYFEWEREARYKIWEAMGKSGLHLHDGIDGAITNLSEDEIITLIKEKTNIRVSADVSMELEYE